MSLSGQHNKTRLIAFRVGNWIIQTRTFTTHSGFGYVHRLFEVKVNVRTIIFHRTADCSTEANCDSQQSVRWHTPSPWQPMTGAEHMRPFRINICKTHTLLHVFVSLCSVFLTSAVARACTVVYVCVDAQQGHTALHNHCLEKPWRLRNSSFQLSKTLGLVRTKVHRFTADWWVLLNNIFYLFFCRGGLKAERVVIFFFISWMIFGKSWTFLTLPQEGPACTTNLYEW